MHAYLLVGNESEELSHSAIRIKSEELAAKFNANILEYPLAKIEDVRELNKLIRLTLTEPTLIYCRNVHEATSEALNAFLKNLEEPQENLYFALTAPSARKVLPTIVSRCQVIRIKNEELIIKNAEQIKIFLRQNIGQRLAFFDKIKDRNQAISFVEDLIFYLHREKIFTNMNTLIKTLSGLKANGNVNLQLTNLVIKLKL